MHEIMFPHRCHQPNLGRRGAFLIKFLIKNFDIDGVEGRRAKDARRYDA